MEFIKLRESVLNEINTRLNKNLEEIKTEEGFKRLSLSYDKKYKKNPQEKLKAFFELKAKKEIENKLNQIKLVEESKDFSGEFIITIEWKKSKMWGYNPTASTNYGFKSCSIGGCGYCKHSTATAYALNSHLSILKLLYTKEENRLNELEKRGIKEDTEKRDSLSRREFIGYGSGYGEIPSFEGGVGVSSHESILKNLGLSMREISNTDKTNVHLIRRMTEEEINQYKAKGY
jgi:hypothetical protein